MENLEQISTAHSTEPPSVAPPEKSGKTVYCLIGIILLSTVLIILQRFMDPEMGRDSSYYLIAAEYWRDGGFQGVLEYFNGNFWFPPLHLFLIAALSHTGLSPETAAMIIGMGCGILMPIVSFFIAGELFHDKRISIAAALLTAVNPSIITMAVQTQRDVPYLFAAGWCIFFIIAAIKRNKWYWWCAAGGTFAISFLIRYESIEFLPLLMIYFTVALYKKQITWLNFCRNLLIFAASSFAALVILLYSTDTLNYMAGSYYRYFIKSTRKVLGIYNGEVQQ